MPTTDASPDSPRFFVPTTLITGMTIALPKEVAHHVMVRRLAVHETLTLFNGHGGEFTARISDLGKADVIVFVEAHVDREAEPPYSVTLAQALTSSEKMDWTIEKAVELGATTITPLSAERSLIKLAGDRIERRHMHWSAVIRAACEQSGRNTLPSLTRLMPVRDFMTHHKDRLRLLASARARAQLCDVLAEHDANLGTPGGTRSVTVLIGPEGGWSDAEEAYGIERGYLPVSLGPRVLRTETAGPAVLAMLQALWRETDPRR